MSDSEYAKDPETRKSVSVNCTILCGAAVTYYSTVHKIVALPVTEAELIAARSNAQSILYDKRLLEYMRFNVKLWYLKWTTTVQ